MCLPPTRGGMPMSKSQNVVDEFNRSHPIGTTVVFWPADRSGPGRSGVTRTEAWLLGGHTPVVKITGKPGCVALSHVKCGQDV